MKGYDAIRIGALTIKEEDLIKTGGLVYRVADVEHTRDGWVTLYLAYIHGTVTRVRITLDPMICWKIYRKQPTRKEYKIYRKQPTRKEY